MEPRLYTSNSEQTQAVRPLPWALLFGIFLLGIVEVVIRLFVPANAFPYDFLAQEYRSFLHQMDSLGPADVCFLGSSRTREDIVVPEFSRLLRESGHDGLRIESYAMSGGWAAEVHSVLRNIIRSGQKPKLVIYGVTPDQFCTNRLHFANTSLLWNLGDWIHHYSRFRTHGYLLPTVLLNEGRKYSHILRWREGVRLELGNFILRNRPLSSPIRGELSPWQRDDPDGVITITPEWDARNREELEEFYGDGRDWVDPIQYGFFEETARICREHGIELVFVELPLTSSLRDNFPGNVSREFLELVKHISKRYGATFVTQAELGLKIEDRQFIDFEHTNLHGALEITRALTNRVILPKLERKLGNPAYPGIGDQNSLPGDVPQ